MTDALVSTHLLLTSRGERWLQNFEDEDRALARDLVGALTLVSASEFERGIARVVHEVGADVEGPVGLYASREVDFDFGSGGIDATPRGSDIGSEGRVAHIIRNIARADPDKYLLQPDVETLRARRIKAAIVVDDLVGSGGRCRDYIQALCVNRSVRSWVSSKHLRFVVAAYAATAQGRKVVEKHYSKPLLKCLRYCPTIQNLPWQRARIEEVRELCRKYAAKAGIYWGLAEGYQNTGSLLVFEHGCPDNVPAILWSEGAGHESTWQPLFESRSVHTSLQEVFPLEVARRDPVNVLIEAGQKRLAIAHREVLDRPLSANVIILLSVIAAGRRRIEALASATGLAVESCERLREACIEDGLVSPLMRITEKGRRELVALRAAGRSPPSRIPEVGEDGYHPKSLRSR